MHLDEDDLYDYDGDSYDEDADVDFVVNSVPGVTPDEAEAELDKADWDVDAAIASLKRKKAVKPQQQKPQQQKPQQKPETKGKLTPLQLLAQKRAETKESRAEPQPEPKPELRKPSLADLAARRAVKTDSENAKASQGEPKAAGSALDRLRQRRMKAEPSSVKPEPKPEPELVRSAKAKSPSDRNQAWEPEISYDLPSKALNPGVRNPSFFGQVISQPEHLHRTSTNHLDTARDAHNAFSKPSPDDVVLNAQASAFMPKTQKTSQPPATAKSTAPKTQPGSAPASKVASKTKAQQSPTLASRLGSLQIKPGCAFVVIGHVDAGKSTLMGRLLLDSGALPAKTVSKYEHESAKAGKSSFWLAWALDATNEERERGVTVDIGEARFDTASTRYTVLDAPGHRDYVPNMIAGVSQADLAVLVVDADTNAFESGFALDGQTKEHAVLARSLGLSTILVAVNKMDTQNWDEVRFAEISELLTDFLTKKVGYSANQCIFVPTSGITGANVVHPPKGDDAAKLGWYDGPTLVGALDTFAANNVAQRRSQDTLRFAVSNAFVEPFQSSTTLTGRVLSGGLEAGDVLEVIQPVGGGFTVTVKAVPSEYLVAGDIGDIKVDFDAENTSLRPGDVLTSSDAGLHATTHFEAKIRLFDIPKPILPGSKLAFHLGRTEDTVKVVRIVQPIGQTIQRKVRHLGRGSAAVVELELSKPVVLAMPDVCKDLGRFVLRMNGSTVGGGVVAGLSAQYINTQ